MEDEEHIFDFTAPIRKENQEIVTTEMNYGGWDGYSDNFDYGPDVKFSGRGIKGYVCLKKVRESYGGWEFRRL